MPTVPTTEPTGVVAGDTIQFQISLADYPASAGWVLHYTLLGRSGVPITWNGSASGSDHLITVTAANTANYAAGLYSATKYVTKAATSERYTIGQLDITIQPNPVTFSAPTDTRSHCKKVLDAIEAVLEGRAGSGDQDITIDGTRIVKMTVEQLLMFRSRYLLWYRQEQQQQRIANGQRPGRMVKMRFE